VWEGSSVFTVELIILTILEEKYGFNLPQTK
jgi:hypothetical protein